MNWKLISKKHTIQPKSGMYSDWKPLLAKEGFHQCVYCSIHDSRFGGIRNFHVEHYKPKKIFSKLINDIVNLFYACAICNTFKGHDWHNYVNGHDFSIIFYPDPSKVDYSTLFEMDCQNGKIKGKNITGIFLVEKFALNRGQLILDRKLNILLNKCEDTIDFCKILRSELFTLAERGNLEALGYLRRLAAALDNLNYTKNILFQTSPYNREDTEK